MVDHVDHREPGELVERQVAERHRDHLTAGTPAHADDRTADVVVENNTEFDIVVSFDPGAPEVVWWVRPMHRRGIRNAVRVGRNPITVTALTPEVARLYKEGHPLSRRSLGQFRTALIVNNPGEEQKLPRQRLVVVDKDFAPFGILGRQGPPAGKLTLEGRWKCPNGSILKVGGENGTLENAVGHRGFGLKDGDQVWRGLKEVEGKLGVYKGEGLFLNPAGKKPGWHWMKIMVTVMVTPKGQVEAKETGDPDADPKERGSSNATLTRLP